MRANPASYDLRAPGSLSGVLSLLQEEPGEWTPIAGGTELMVQFSAGTLGRKKLVSIWNLAQLQGIEVEPKYVSVGAGSTFTELRNHETIRREFPMLAQSAALTGSIANQNRGTLGGNLANASPAADSSPPLLAYDAELELVSVKGFRRVPYSSFHVGYKQTLLKPEELLLRVLLPRGNAGRHQYFRKVGTRNAQAISKVVFAGAMDVRSNLAHGVRIGIGSVSYSPLRCAQTEELLTGARLDRDLIAFARRTLEGEIKPIDDIRSVAEYRKVVAGNLLEEFLNGAL